MTTLRNQLLDFMKTYLQAKTEPFKEHRIGNLMRNEIPEIIYRETELSREKYKITGSVGQGNWANVPWVAVMNKSVTTSTQRGFYLVYLFAEDMSHVYLTLAQGVTETSNEEMKRINLEIREKLHIKEPHIHKNNDFDLGTSKKAVDYKKSTALYIPYSINGFPSEEQLVEDLLTMVKYYEEYIEKSKSNILSEIMENFLKDLITLNAGEVNLNELYEELKPSIVRILSKKPVNKDSITYRGKEIIESIPFVNERDNVLDLIQYTTLEMPNASHEHLIQALRQLLDSTVVRLNESVRSRALRGLSILNLVDENNNPLVSEIPDETEQQKRIASVPIIHLILKTLEIVPDWSVSEKNELLREIIRSIVVSSKNGTRIKESVLEKRYGYTIDWLKTVNLVDDNLRLIDPNIVDQYQPGIFKETVRETYEFTNDKELITHIHNYIQSKGFHYEKEEVKNLYLSLRSKPFVILSGISGTGKTKMVQWFAESVGATEENGQFSLIPIRPDWNDGSDLLGYVDIKGDFKEGPLTKVIKHAAENPELPHFILLDEMNLARVEHYFSDILSVMESRKWKNDEVVSAHLLTKEVAGFDLTLPNNIYIFGTVNMDETTYPFSKKVLDRANTIEFNRVELDHFAFLHETKEIAPVQLANDSFASEYLHLKDAYQGNEELIERVTDELVRINRVLEKSKSHVGYRVRDEICFYMIYNAKENLMDFSDALDHCILQKILPRIAGSDSSVDLLLRELFEMFTNTALDEENNLQEIDEATAAYPRSAAKVLEMHRRLTDGYTSFWIS
jgi:MoxR-like ATPase